MPRLSSRIALRARVCAFCGLRGTVWHLNNRLIQVELLSLIFLSPTNNPPLKLLLAGVGRGRGEMFGLTLCIVLIEMVPTLHVTEEE